jgi:hypothetical protein
MLWDMKRHKSYLWQDLAGMPTLWWANGRRSGATSGVGLLGWPSGIECPPAVVSLTWMRPLSAGVMHGSRFPIRRQVLGDRRGVP